MDGTVVAVFLFGTFLGGLTSGLAGFAMGLVVSGIWLHVIAPLQTATLIVGFGLVTQGYAIWKLRGALDWLAVAPFILGGAFGVPVGTMLLTFVDPATARNVVGWLLIAYSAYGLARPRFKPIATNISRDLAIGGVNGLLGGITGLTGIVVTIWCQLIGLPTLLAGLWCGFKLYGRLDDAGFRKVILLLLLVAGGALLAPLLLRLHA